MTWGVALLLSMAYGIRGLDSPQLLRFAGKWSAVARRLHHSFYDAGPAMQLGQLLVAAWNGVTIARRCYADGPAEHRNA